MIVIYSKTIHLKYKMLKLMGVYVKKTTTNPNLMIKSVIPTNQGFVD